MALIEEFDLPGRIYEGLGQQQITQKSELAWPGDDIPDETALKIVVQDKQLAEQWVRSHSWLSEWERNERLYRFQVPKRSWDGTNVPRSHLGMPLVYEHVESLLPQLMSSVFSDDPPFSFDPLPSTSMDVARANVALIGWQLKQTDFREEVRLGLKHMLLHGMGVWKRGWKRYTRPRTIYKRKAGYKYHPVAVGAPIKLAQADTNTIEKVVKDELINQPSFESRSLRQILVDPGLQTTDVRDGKYVIDVQYMTAIELDQLRDFEGYNIPARDTLMSLFFDPAEAANPNPIEAMNRVEDDFQTPKLRWENTTVDKLQHPLRVDEYWTNDRVFTVVQDKLVIRNEVNPFGEIPFYSLAMADVLGEFKGIGTAELIGNEQRMQQGVINTFLDELALSINGMFVRKRGADVRSNSLRMRPGGIIEVDDVKDVTTLQRSPIPTSDIQAVLAASDSRASKRTAASETSVQGSMPSGQSSITRTAAGVNSLSSGTGTRLQELVLRFATQVMIPYLNGVHAMNGMFLDPEQIDRILSQKLGVAYQGDPIDIMNAEGEFDVKAASLMQSKAAMKQNIPLLYQFLLTEPVMNGLAAQGMKVNVAELVNMTFDVSGFHNENSVIVPMSPEDIQKEQANSQAAQQQAKQQSQLQNAAQMENIKTQAKSQLLEQDNTDRTGRDLIKQLISKDDDAALGLGGR